MSLSSSILDNTKANPTIRRVDFVKEGLPDLDGCYAWVLDDVLDADECDALISWSDANLNGVREFLYNQENEDWEQGDKLERNCTRAMHDMPEIWIKIWKRIEPMIPEVQQLRNLSKVTGMSSYKDNNLTWNFSGLNERARFLRYVEGQFINRHCDEFYHTPTSRSMFTVHIALNGGEPELNAGGAERTFDGGATTFHSWEDPEKSASVYPRRGRVMVFQQSGLLHSGTSVHNGTKYVMKTDLMYDLDISQ